ncbi:glycosyltransferase family 4 protein [Candidatus Contubernalis alkaliaceticus]|uniref:glycosyltransferase family 4 protein n=1 Tax=Candidatus Contubernalis alkaliaceticus TaxID=338645 RepID=UPI001F4C4F7E|nr:glycosyltransferase family 4 protein [Candidatus Contubernalis alkalaceticus]UNC91470.1 glycosyltransferase family 4 protein [Candidatus Contubernalis alkalaceticus]
MKKKVMYVVRSVEGGIREHIKVLIQYLKPSYDLVVVCPLRGDLAESFEKTGARIIPLNISEKLNPFRDFPQVLYLARIIQKERPDIIHLHGFKAGFIGRLSSLGFSKIPVVLTVHNYYAYPEMSKIPLSYFKQAEKLLSRRVSRIITVSDALKENLTFTLGIDEKKITRIYNGIDYARLEGINKKSSEEKINTYKARLGIPLEAPLIGTAARMAPQKGLGIFLEAANNIIREGRSCLFLLAGDGPMMEQLKNRIRDLNLQGKVIFPGRVADISEFLACLDIFVLPSLSEGLSITLLEALAAEKPVVASRVGGVPEIVIDGITGGLVPPGDPVSLASKVLDFLDNPQKSKNMGIQGKLRVMDYFDIKDMVKRTEDLYKDLCS